MASRSKAKAEEAIADLKKDTGKEAIFLQLDLASLDAVKKAAEEYTRYVSIQMWVPSMILTYYSCYR